MALDRCVDSNWYRSRCADDDDVVDETEHRLNLGCVNSKRLREYACGVYLLNLGCDTHQQYLYSIHIYTNKCINADDAPLSYITIRVVYIYWAARSL